MKGIYILQKKHNIKLNIVFSGNDKGNKERIKSYAKRLKVFDRLLFTDFVSDQELIALYKNSLALVMPTYFGPTNLPPLEAFKIGVPVIYPDLNGLREQVGNAALLIDLNDPNSLSEAIIKLLKNKNLKNDLITKGYKIANKSKNYNRIEALESILITFLQKYSNFRTRF